MNKDAKWPLCKIDLTLLLLALFLSTAFLHAQEDTIRKARKWAIGVSVSPDYSYRILEPIQYDDTLQQIPNQENKNAVDSLNIVEKGKLAFTFGISFSYAFNSHFSLNSGFYYSDKGIQSKGFVYGNGINYGYNIFKNDSYKKTSFYFYEVPLSLSFKVFLDSVHKYSTLFVLGAVMGVNSQKHDYISRRWYDISKDPNDESSYRIMYAETGSVLHIGYMVGCGINIKASDRINFGLTPIIKYYPHEFFSRKVINWHNANQLPITTLEIEEKPYSIGCNFNLGFCF